MTAGAGLAAALLVMVVAAAVRPVPRRRASGDPAVATRSRLDGVVASLQQRRALRRIPTARDVAEWCDDLARLVRSGSSLRDALDTVVPVDVSTAAATAPMRLAIARGTSVGDAVDRAGPAGPHLYTALSVIATASRLGGPCAAAIDRTAMTLRQRAADEGERAVQAAQARLSSHVMTAVPLLMLGVLLATDHDVRAVAVSPIGAICIVAGLTLNAAGSWWMHRIVRSGS